MNAAQVYTVAVAQLQWEVLLVPLQIHAITKSVRNIDFQEVYEHCCCYS
jgi:ribosomal protein L25 (general stress protein Ctc)